MKAVSLKVVFDRKGTATEKTEGLIQIEVYCDRKRKYISTGIKVYAKQFDEKSFVVNRLDSDILNKQITDMLIDLRSFINASGNEFTLRLLDDYDRNNKSSFIEFMRAETDRRNDVDGRTKRRHHVAADFLEKYRKIITFNDLTLDNIMEMDNYLRGKGFKDSTIYDYHKRIRTYAIIAERKGLIKKSPYSSMKLKKGDYEDIKYLTDEEVERIRNAEIDDESIEKVRDCFLFQCYTGLAYVDLAKFDFSDVEEIDGKHYIIDKRQKTKTPYRLTLLSPAMEILSKYDNTLPVISNQQYNMRLKVLASYAKIKKTLTTHMARHTFATWVLSKGIKIETVSKMLAHKDIKTTQIYAKVLQKSVDEAFEELEDTFS